LGVDQEHRDIRIGGLLYGGHGTVRVRRVQDQSHRVVGDRGVHEVHFLVDVTAVGRHGRIITEVLGSGGGDIALGLPVRVGGVIDDDRDQTAGLTRSGVFTATGSFLG